MKYIRVSRVKEHVHSKGKRVTRGFLAWLDHRVEVIIDRQIHIMGSRSTLNAQDAALLWK